MYVYASWSKLCILADGCKPYVWAVGASCKLVPQAWVPRQKQTSDDSHNTVYSLLWLWMDLPICNQVITTLLTTLSLAVLILVPQHSWTRTHSNSSSTLNLLSLRDFLGLNCFSMLCLVMLFWLSKQYVNYMYYLFPYKEYSAGFIWGNFVAIDELTISYGNSYAQFHQHIHWLPCIGACKCEIVLS